ncbi:hypothetical protein [Nonomuraea jabiensis]|uniref:DUF4352 domain-containing protein n=1 Tax=Nonomuraea jabiensis TaxID=882448 RepID=A0A7W9LB95_9ACTN|nr:hypothetical protein [Nonomuraea jabiensis]MBB5777507.1 hypothetical protein [Nonomuraea jabiensis]
MRKTIALAVAAVALAGCGALPGRQVGGGGEEKQPQTVAESTTEPPATAKATEAPPQETRAIASREADVYAGDNGKARARVDITALKRQGRTLSLNWTVTALEGKVNVHNGLGTGPLDMTVSAVSLIDPVNAKRYRVARNGTDQNAQCVCSGTQGQFLDKGQTSTLYAVFAAPPADVTKINIEMPMIGVLTDVPIS